MIDALKDGEMMANVSDEMALRLLQEILYGCRML